MTAPSFRRVSLPVIETEQDSYAFEQALRQAGWSVAGFGSYASVYSKPGSHKVIKIARGDAAYNTFLEYALAYQNNPYFPRIYDVKRYVMRDSASYTVVTMEKLKPIYDNYKAVNERYDIEDKVVFGFWTWAQKANTSLKGFFSVADKNKFQAVRIVQELMGDHRPDMHHGNFMLRNNQIVITDPVY